MSAVSQQQQKLFGLALSVKRGETPRSEVSQDVLGIVDSMSEKEIEKYAGTEHKGLPKKVEQKLRETIRGIVREKMSVNEKVTLSTSQMKQVHDNYKNFKEVTLLNWQVLPSLIKTFGKMNKKSLEGLIKMKPKAPLSLIIQKYLEGNFKNFESVNEGISVFDERHFGKKGIIIMIDDNGKKVSAIFKDKKNADKFNRNNPSDIKKLLQLAKKTKFPKAIDESVNEGASRTAMEIGGLTGMNKDAIQKFVDDNNLDIEKVFRYVKKGNFIDRMDLVSAIAGKPNNPVQKKMIKMFKESVNEAVSKTYKIPTQRGTLHIEVEEDPAGVFVDVIFNRVDLTTTDIQFPTGEVKVTQRQKRVKLKESVMEGKKRFYQQDRVGSAKYTISYHDGKQKHKDGSDFYGIQTFRNKQDLEKFRAALLKKGYREDSGFKKESVNEADLPGEAVGYIEKNGRKKLIKTFKSLRAGKMWLTKERDKYLNQSGVERIGTMNKGDWDKHHAKYAESVEEAIKPKVTVSRKEYDRLHKDFKGMVDGHPYMVYLDKKTGATVYGPVKIKESVVNEGKFKVDDLVYNKRTKTVGIVRMGDDKYGEVKTDADGNVSVDELEKYNPIKNRHHQKVKVAPSTEKEINKRGLFNPFKSESVNEQEKTLPELMKIANQFKKELNDLQREYNKNKTQTILNRVEAKKGQLLRVANAIRAAKAKQAESVNEGRGFVNAARKAKEEGKTEFEYNGKTYPVTLKEGMLNEMSDAEFVADQLSNPVADGTMGRSEFMNFVSKETNVDKNTLGKVYDAYFKLGGRDRVKLDRLSNALKFLSKFGIK